MKEVERLLLAPFRAVPQELEDRKIFFLAGPIAGGDNWQRDAADFLWNQYPGCIVADPSYKESNTQPKSTVTVCGHIDHTSFLQQAEWESYAMNLAARKGTLFFWLPRESTINPRPREHGVYAQDTRVEIGIWIERYKNNPNLSIQIGGDAWFDGLQFIYYYMKEGIHEMKLVFSAHVTDFLRKTI